MPQFRLILERLVCRKTTEDSHDEVYYIMGAGQTDGGKTTFRGPDRSQGASADEGTAWDMNDRGRSATGD